MMNLLTVQNAKIFCVVFGLILCFSASFVGFSEISAEKAKPSPNAEHVKTLNNMTGLSLSAAIFILLGSAKIESVF